jgi:hypothetical protein
MPPSAPIFGVSPQVRLAFDEGCRDLFATSAQPLWRGRGAHDVLLRFAGHYQRLSALPRRVRRAVERQWKRSLSTIALLMTLGQVPAWAAMIPVTPATPPSINADGKCSLIEAIVNANRDARAHLDCVEGSGPDTIVLPTSSQQVLNAQQMLPAITSPIVIEGNGSTVLRNTRSRLAFFAVGVSGNLTLNETTVTGTEDSSWVGYGVSNAGRLALNNSSIARTGGLFNSGGVAVLNDSSVTGTRTGPDNYPYGGIQNRNGGTLTVSNSTIAGNSAEFRGGGLYNGVGSTATLTNSIVAGNNISYEGSGGGIHNYGTLVLLGTAVTGNEAQFGAGLVNRGTATIRRSTISGNRIDAQYGYESAGGIGNLGTLTLVNSTVSANEAPAYAGGIYSGNNGTLTILSSTVTGNALVASLPYFPKPGGGVAIFSGTLTLQRSIVSGNTARKGREIYADADVVVRTNDFNVFGREGDAGISGFTTGSTDIVPNESLRGILLPLADNGGSTQTHALAIGSPALDASPDDAGCPTVDQRGTVRPRGPACDIGAFEGSAVLCSGRTTTMVGTDGPDELTGTPGPDVIAGLNGDDAIGGLEGNDVICGGGGADSLFGASGNDLLLGQGGHDRLFGHSGNDTLNGGDGQDQCDGGVNAGAPDTATACETVKNVP